MVAAVTAAATAAVATVAAAAAAAVTTANKPGCRGKCKHEARGPMVRGGAALHRDARLRSDELRERTTGAGSQLGKGKQLSVTERQMVRLAFAESISKSVTAGHEEYLCGKFFKWRNLLLMTIDDGSYGGFIGVENNISAERALCDIMLADGFVYTYFPNGGTASKVQPILLGTIQLVHLSG
eukprot:5402613-Pleurochrysis_carterae.AAC.1